MRNQDLVLLGSPRGEPSLEQAQAFVDIPALHEHPALEALRARLGRCVFDATREVEYLIGLRECSVDVAREHAEVRGPVQRVRQRRRMTELARERVGSRGSLVRLDDVACEPCGHCTERVAADRRVVAHVDEAVLTVRRLVVERQHIGDVRTTLGDVA